MPCSGCGPVISRRVIASRSINSFIVMDLHHLLLAGLPAHSACKKLGLNLVSEPTEKGRVYRIKDVKASPAAAERAKTGGLCRRNVAEVAPELSLNFGDGRAGQAAAVMG